MVESGCLMFAFYHNFKELLLIMKVFMAVGEEKGVSAAILFRIFWWKTRIKLKNANKVIFFHFMISKKKKNHYLCKQIYKRVWQRRK